MNLTLTLLATLAIGACERSASPSADPTSDSAPTSAPGGNGDSASGAVSNSASPDQAGESSVVPLALSESKNSLRELVAVLLRAQHLYSLSDIEAAAAEAERLIPDAARLSMALGDAVTPEARAKLESHFAALPRAKEKLVTMISGGKDAYDVDILVATPEELKLDEPGSEAYGFADGARDAAVAGFLKPGLRFYQIEIREPGDRVGIRYSLFYWDGSQWTMLGPIWRVIDIPSSPRTPRQLPQAPFVQPGSETVPGAPANAAPTTPPTTPPR
ncbi:MAG: hypothetical protein SFZ23_15975 [Planctomycetota bacterium]|nr:hypothetical protein [Planctomycetota bacterium]